jgi:two-component system C4-dicarboxylate transport response regulator DctD
LTQFEPALIEEMLRRHRGKGSATSEALGLPTKPFEDKLHRFNVTADEFR